MQLVALKTRSRAILVVVAILQLVILGGAIYLKYPLDRGQSPAEAFERAGTVTLPAILGSLGLWVLAVVVVLLIEVRRRTTDQPTSSASQSRNILFSFALIVGVGNLFATVAGYFFTAQVGRVGNQLGQWELFTPTVVTALVLLFASLCLVLYDQFERLENK